MISEGPEALEEDSEERHKVSEYLKILARKISAIDSIEGLHRHSQNVEQGH